MPKSQTLITAFFKTERKPMRQTTIDEYFKPKKCTFTLPKIQKANSYVRKFHYKMSRKHLNMYRNQTDAVGTYEGYCFCATNNFREYTAHTTYDRCLNIKDKEVFIPAGTIVASATVDDDSALEHISVELPFQRQGIAKNLIRFINKSDTQFHVYAGIEHNSRYRLTEEGAALIRACQDKGILEYEQVILGSVPPSPSLV